MGVVDEVDGICEELVAASMSSMSPLLNITFPLLLFLLKEKRWRRLRKEAALEGVREEAGGAARVK
jgi:hypothetical protein